MEPQILSVESINAIVASVTLSGEPSVIFNRSGTTPECNRTRTVGCSDWHESAELRFRTHGQIMREGDSQEGGAGMVVIDYPDNTCHKFFLADSTMFGPLDQNGVYQAVQVPVDLYGGLFEPKRRIYGENEIRHSTIRGKVFYYPILADCIPYPEVIYPRKMNVPVKEGSGYVMAHHGFGCPEIGSRVYAHPSSQQILQTVTRDETGKSYTLYRLLGLGPNSGSCYPTVTTYTFKGWKSATEAYFDKAYKYSPYGTRWSYGWSKSPTHTQIIEAVNKVSDWRISSPAVVTLRVYTTVPSRTERPASLAEQLGNFVNNTMAEHFALPEIDYGDLAARAVRQKSSLDMNLYEFLRDLPELPGLIPKLQNLSALKTHAGNYLAYKFGILPTLSDLKTIREAFERRLPYLDKNGFSVFNASHHDLQVVDNTIYKLDQYAKVAVSNEDSEFLQLLTQLDEHGLGLNLENVWDLVKYSFAIDWFVNVGGFLKRIDQNQRLLRYNIPYVTMSRKCSVTGEVRPETGLCTLGPVEWRYYHRWVDSQCPLPPLTLSISPTVTSHWLEAGSLIIQRAN